MRPASLRWWLPTLVVFGALLGLTSTVISAAVAASAELGAWLQGMGWWSYPLRGLAGLQGVVAIALGLRALRRPLPTWAWLVLPALTTTLGSLATLHGLAQGRAALVHVDPGQRAMLWAAGLGEALPALALVLMVAAQGGAAQCLGAGLGVLRLAPAPSSARPWVHAVAVAVGGLLFAIALGAWLTGNFGDADVARLAWLGLWLGGLGFALVPAVLGANALGASPHPDERSAGLRLAAQSAAGAVLALVATAAALWLAHVAQALLTGAHVDTVAASTLAARSLLALARTLGSAGLATILVLALAALVLGPLLARARPAAGDARGAVYAAVLVAVAAASVAGASWRAIRLSDDALGNLVERAPTGLALVALDVERLHSPEVPLLVLEPAGARLDGRRLAGSLVAGDLAPAPAAPAAAVAVAATAALRAGELAPWLQALRAAGIREVRLVVERIPVPEPVEDGAAWPPLPGALLRTLQTLTTLRFERWGVVPLRLDDGATTASGERAAEPGQWTRLSVSSATVVASSSDGTRTEVRVAPDGRVDLAPLVSPWRALAGRQALPAQLALQVDDDVPLALLIAVVDAAQFATRGSEAGADPFGHDADARREALHAHVTWVW